GVRDAPRQFFPDDVHRGPSRRACVRHVMTATHGRCHRTGRGDRLRTCLAGDGTADRHGRRGAGGHPMLCSATGSPSGKTAAPTAGRPLSTPWGGGFGARLGGYAPSTGGRGAAQPPPP